MFKTKFIQNSRTPTLSVFHRNSKREYFRCVCVHGVAILCNICVSYNSSDSIFPPFFSSSYFPILVLLFVQPHTAYRKNKSESTVRGHFLYITFCVCISLWTVLWKEDKLLLLTVQLATETHSPLTLEGAKKKNI